LTRERWAQIRQIFDAALERPAQDRAAYLQVACARDHELRREVENLLESHDTATDFSPPPAPSWAKRCLRAAIPPAVTRPTITPKATASGLMNSSAGSARWRMGSVWLASRADQSSEAGGHQDGPARTDSQEILRRFRIERQLLAGLDHPNIARLIDGGSTPDGLPFLVMEYVQGTRIDQYCESRKLPISERLQLFRAVCSAVQYAHQNLVVHRDIKTGNILVTAGGVPKLLDFGIANVGDSAVDRRRPFPPHDADLPVRTSARRAITTSTDTSALGIT
jgi:serine/threonine protein kinase